MSSYIWIGVISIALFFSFSKSVSAQIAVGEWRDHLPSTHAFYVENSPGNIFCATSWGVINYDKINGTSTYLNKINGLSDIDVSAIGFNSQNNCLIIGYLNGNLDIWSNGSVYNISDIKRKTLSGSKAINHILCIGNLAYLSCGFGIVVLDISRKEIKESYLIGPNGSYLTINQIATDNSYLYAATAAGIFKGALSNPNLVDYNQWVNLTDLPTNHPYAWIKNEPFNTLALYHNKLYVNYDPGDDNNDKILILDGTSWSSIDTVFKNTQAITVFNDHITFVTKEFLRTFDSGMNQIDMVDSYNYTWRKNFRHIIYDEYNGLWIADFDLGFYRRSNGWPGFTRLHEFGPGNSLASCIAAGGNKVWVAPGSVNGSWGNTWTQGELYSFKNENWKTFDGEAINKLYSIIDILKVIVDPSNSEHVYAGSWNGGLLEFLNDQLVKVYDSTNSTLQSVIPGGQATKIGGFDFDESGNLWMTNSDVPKPISVKTANGSWYSFNYSNDIDALVISDLIVTKNNHKWVVIPRGGGLFAFNENGTYSNSADDKKKKFGLSDEFGKLITSDVYSIAEDKNGIIWVGTSMGILVYYNPENVFTGNNFYASRIKVPNEIPGQANYLLETEIVSAIAVDGANRKWIGTENSGVFLMSDDGTKEVYHFNTENSPLISNNIRSIGVDEVSGEVFFGTDKGIVSFRSTATEGKEEYSEVISFPNPVPPGYNGYITISGLVTNSNVKITDIAGNIVYETTSEGGQAIWNGKTFSGVKVQTGIYLVYSASEDGTKTNVTKILVLN